MMNSSDEVIVMKGKIGLNSLHHHTFSNDIVRHDQYYQDVGKLKDRLQKTPPNIQQVIHMDMERMKINKVYERKLHRDLTRSGGLSSQCKQELERLCSAERDLKRLNRDLSKVTLLPSISRSPLFSQNHTPRLSSIVEENSSLPTMDKPKLVRRHLLSINPSRTALNHIKPIPKQSSNGKIKINYDHSYPLYKQYLQQVIAKTSDDRRYFQQHMDMMNQQKRFIELKLKEFLH